MSITPTYYQGSTAVFRIKCFDEVNEPVIPKTLKWTLRRNGAVVNNRENVTMSALGFENVIMLSGPDLVGDEQCLIVEGTYDSTLGLNLPIRKWQKFFVSTSC